MSFLLEYPVADRPQGRGADTQVSELRTTVHNLHPEPTEVRSADKRLVILGSPIIGRRIDRQGIARTLSKDGAVQPTIQQINGSFLIIVEDRRTRELTVINDRFASIPFFYRVERTGVLVASITYTDIGQADKGATSPALVEENFYEFIHLQRLLGSKTYDKDTRFLEAASVLTYSASARTVTASSYWQPVFKKDSLARLDQFAEALALALRRAVEARTSDSRSYGLLLSGGLDSRALLAATEAPITCFTVGERRNAEVRIAASVADAKGSPHVFVLRSPDHYAAMVDQAVALGSAMNVYDHAHFIGLGDAFSGRADVLFHGHGLDYFFQGLYLPTERATVAGRPTYLDRLRPVREPLAVEYLDRVKYRLGSTHAADAVRPEHRGRMRDSLVASVEAVMNEGRNRCQDEYDLWEYMHLHNLSRHYTFLNLLSIRTFAEERTACFDNEVYDLYLRMPVKYRLSGRVLKRAIAKMDGRLARIENANTRLPASYGPYASTLTSLGARALRKLGANVERALPPAAHDRSWPDRNEMIRTSPALGDRIHAMSRSESLASLGFLDMDSISVHVDRHMRGQGNYGALLLTLLTIDSFLAAGAPAPATGDRQAR